MIAFNKQLLIKKHGFLTVYRNHVLHPINVLNLRFSDIKKKILLHKIKKIYRREIRE